MALFTNTRTARAAAARTAAARPARQSATATAAATATATARRTALVSIDGGPFVAVPFAPADFATASNFAECVVSAIAFAHTGLVPTGIREIGGSKGHHAGTFNAGRKQIAFAFKAAPAPKPAPAPAPVSAEPAPAPVTAPAPKALPAPAVAAALKASSAAARDASREIVKCRITFEGRGSFDVNTSRAELSTPADFMRLYVAPRAAAYFEWPRVTVDYASRVGTDSYNGAVSHGRVRVAATWAIIARDAAPPAVAMPARAGMGLAPRADALAQAMGRTSAVAEAEAKAKAAGVRLSRTDRTAAEAVDAARAKSAAGKAPVTAAPRMNASNAAILEAAATGVLPSAPDFSAETHTRYRGKLAELVALVAACDVAKLEAYFINPISTSPKALNRYRNAAVIALKAQAASGAGKGKGAGR